MLQVRFHGRGGQGAVTAAELLSVAAFHDGKFAQAFPSFGSERMGAPVASFCRIADRPIRTREPVVAADVVVVQDATLLHAVEVFQGLSEKGWVVINSAQDLPALGLQEFAQHLPSGHTRTVAATELASAHIGRPVPNAALLGALVALTDAVSLASLQRAIRERFAGPVGEGNVGAATAAYDAAREARSC